MLAWEIEVPDLGIDAEKLNYKLQNGKIFKKINTRFENNNQDLKNKILNKLDIDYIKKQIPEYKEISIHIFKDLPGFKLWPHLDRKDHKGFIVINLTDNKDSTEFLDFDEKFLAKSSNKKNKGVFHILWKKPYCLHAIENTSDKNRYTTIAFIK